MGTYLLRKLQSLVYAITGDLRLLILISKPYVFKNLTTDQNQFKPLIRYYRNLQFHPTSSQNYSLPYLLPTKIICDLQNPESKKNILLELNHELKPKDQGKLDVRSISEDGNRSLMKCDLQCDICGMLRNNANSDKCFMLCKEVLQGSHIQFKPFNESTSSQTKAVRRKRPTTICGVSLCFTCQTEQGVNDLDRCAMHYEHTDNVDNELDITVIENSVKYVKDVLENNYKKDMRDIYFSPTFQKMGSKDSNRLWAP